MKKIKGIQPDLYHKPMLLVLVNSVNTEDADLKRFFRELERIGKKIVEQVMFSRQAIEELLQELKQEPEFMFERWERKLKIDKQVLKSITIDEVLNYVLMSQAGGEIEVLIRPSNKKGTGFSS